MHRRRWNLAGLAIAILAALALGLLMGGVYSLPAMSLTKCRDPWFTVLLAMGLSTTVIGLGLALGLSVGVVLAVWVGASIVLLVRRCFGPLDHNLERFGLVHAVTLVAVGWAWVISRLVA